MCNLTGKNFASFDDIFSENRNVFKMVLFKTFSGIYNICCLFNGQPKMSKVALGLRSLVAVVEGITGSISLFYILHPEQTEIMFKLYRTFVCLAVFDIFLVGLDLFYY